MPDPNQAVVINTTPLIALSVATGSLEILRALYQRVVITQEVQQEILAGGQLAPGVDNFLASEWLERLPEPQAIPLYLQNTLDRGEASVIQAALTQGITRVCIDEKVGRRIARLHGLTLTGSMGILAKAKQAGYPLDIEQALLRLHHYGVWLGNDVKQFLRETTKETLNKWLRGRIAALRGARSLAYLLDMWFRRHIRFAHVSLHRNFAFGSFSRSLRSVRLALHPARRFIQRFPNGQESRRV